MQLLVLEGKVIRQLYESLRSEFFVKISVKDCSLSDAEDQISGPLTGKFLKSLRNQASET